MSKAAQGSCARRGGAAVAALEAQLARVRGGERSALDTACDRKDAARPDDKGVALCLREPCAEKGC